MAFNCGQTVPVFLKKMQWVMVACLGLLSYGIDSQLYLFVVSLLLNVFLLIFQQFVSQIPMHHCKFDCKFTIKVTRWYVSLTVNLQSKLQGCMKLSNETYSPENVSKLKIFKYCKFSEK